MTELEPPIDTPSSAPRADATGPEPPPIDPAGPHPRADATGPEPPAGLTGLGAPADAVGVPDESDPRVESPVHVLVEDGGAAGRPAEAILAAAVGGALTRLGQKGAVTLVLTGDEELRALNRDFRGLDKVTDVLSFGADPGATEPGADAYLGDVVISVPQAARQAAELGHELAAELRLLAVHGLLHLLGYDDVTDAEADAMEAMERELGVR